jgi:hypothetical protein
MITTRTRVPGALALLAMATVLAACGNPASPGEHRFAYGVVIREGGETVVRAQGSNITGSLAVAPGQTRGPLTVRLLNREGGDMEPRQGYWLRVTSSSPGVARWQQASEGELGGSLVGVAAGAATLEFCNMHGAVGRGHADGCQSVPVLVSQQ